MSHEGRIRIAAICGSVRPGNYTRKALGLTLDELGKDPDVAVDAIYPEEFDLPLPGLPATGDGPERLREIVGGATGVVIATPEYHGSFSSVTKLVIENLGFPSVLSGKPVMLLGVAAGSIGAIKSLEQLRGVCAHVGAIALPLPVSIAGFREPSTKRETASTSRSRDECGVWLLTSSITSVRTLSPNPARADRARGRGVALALR